ncbi:hypothetical protein U9M48_021454 [Paspalum notatum var. saurae]|uniref:Uncharacterized protein n=1 Tax=Paspalum notatum var. saurae TaxID=547442 RepID=A0AAQ3WTL0_PASNO
MWPPSACAVGNPLLQKVHLYGCLVPPSSSSSLLALAARFFCSSALSSASPPLGDDDDVLAPPSSSLFLLSWLINDGSMCSVSSSAAGTSEPRGRRRSCRRLLRWWVDRRSAEHVVPVRFPDCPERLGAVAHGRPVVPDGPHAAECELQQRLERAFDGGRPREVRVEHVGGVAGDEPGHGPSRAEALLHLALGLDGAARGGELHEEDAEGVDVAAVRELARLEVLRVQVPRRALHLRGHVRGGAGAGAGAEAGEAEVGDLGAERVGEEDVGGLDVAVDDGVVRVHVEVGDGVRHVDGDVEAGAQVQEPAAAPVQVLPQRAVGHVLHHHHPLLAALQKRTRLWCWIRAMIFTSLRNSTSTCGFCIRGLPRFTATTVPSGRTPRYTAPNPPCPILSDGEKLLVARRISSMEKTELWNDAGRRCCCRPPFRYSPRADTAIDRQGSETRG